MALNEVKPVARLLFVGEDGFQFERGVTCLGDVPLAIRYQMGMVTDCGDHLQGESGQKLVGFFLEGGPERIFDLVPSTTRDIWAELMRMSNSFPDDLSKYNIQQTKPEVH